MRSEVLVVILAGGEGRRIGGGKPLRTLGGERLIDRALRQAKRWSHAVAVAVRDPAQVEPLEVDLITDAPEVSGPLAGLLAGLRHADAMDSQLLLTIPADTPFLPGDLLKRLREAGHGNCALASSGGVLHPACALWRTQSLEFVQGYVATERRSLKGLAELVGLAVVEWPSYPVDPFFNVNDADDLSEAERLS